MSDITLTVSAPGPTVDLAVVAGTSVTLTVNEGGGGGVSTHAELPDLATSGHPASVISGLGGAATKNVGTTAGTVAAGDDSRITGALSAATAASTYQPLDADLTAVAALTTPATTISNAVLKTTVDAKGDLLVGTADDTVARKAAGTNGYVLVAQSGTSDGLTWQAQSGLVVNTVAAAGTTETLDGDDYNIHDITLDESVTFTFSTSATVAQFTLILRQDGSGGNSVTWPGSVKWHSLTAPTILTSANAVHVLEFLTVNSGTTWRGFLASSAAS